MRNTLESAALEPKTAQAYTAAPHRLSEALCKSLLHIRERAADTKIEDLTSQGHFCHCLLKMASQTDEVAALKRRIEELERAVAEHESGAVVEPHLAANKDLEATCTRLRQRCEQLERENSTLALALAYRQVSGGGGGGGADDDATAEVPS